MIEKVMHGTTIQTLNWTVTAVIRHNWWAEIVIALPSSNGTTRSNGMQISYERCVCISDTIKSNYSELIENDCIVNHSEWKLRLKLNIVDGFGAVRQLYSILITWSLSNIQSVGTFDAAWEVIGVRWAECLLIIGSGCRVHVFSLIVDSSVG